MSQSNVEVYRKFNEVFRRGEWDAFAAALDPHVLVRTDPSWPEQRIYGREAVVTWYRGMEDTGTSIDNDEIVDLGDRLLVRFRWTQHGRASGVEGQTGVSQIMTFREGRLILIEFFFEHEQALAVLEMGE